MHKVFVRRQKAMNHKDVRCSCSNVSIRGCTCGKTTLIVRSKTVNKFRLSWASQSVHGPSVLTPFFFCILQVQFILLLQWRANAVCSTNTPNSVRKRKLQLWCASHQLVSVKWYCKHNTGEHKQFGWIPHCTTLNKFSLLPQKLYHFCLPVRWKRRWGEFFQ